MKYPLSAVIPPRLKLQAVIVSTTLAAGCLSLAASGQTTTTTTFTITANGVPLTTVDTRSTVKLTAAVTAGSSKVTTGQVAFCDASFKKSCLDFRQVGTAQLTGDGTASLRFIPGPGEHTYKAVFLGTTTNAASTSPVSTLTVQGGPAPHETKTSLSARGSNGSYTLTANVTGPSSALPLIPGGLVYFVDRSDSEKVLGKAKLPTDFPAINYTGTSQPLAKHPAPALRSLAIGDFNGDGKPDMIVCKRTACPAVELGNGDGTFREPPSQPALMTSVTGVQKGDFNADGALDLVVTYHVQAAEKYATYLYRGVGDGTFLPPTKIPLGTEASPIVTVIGVADFNKDGLPDLLVSYLNKSWPPAPTAGVVLGDGKGAFAAAGWISEPEYSLGPGVAIGDFDGDGFQDFAIHGHDYDDNEFLSLFFGSTDGTFQEKKIVDYGYVEIAADLNGDGRAEIIETYSEYDDFAEPPFFGIKYCFPDRTVTERGVRGLEPLYDETYGIHVDDFNRDGIADILTDNESYQARQQTQVIFLGGKNGSFTEAKRTQSSTPIGFQDSQEIGTADFNGDGIPDVAADGTQAGTGYPAFGALITQVGQSAAASVRPPTGGGDHEVVARYQGDTDFVSSVSEPTVLIAPPQGSPVAVLSSTYLQFEEEPVTKPSNAKTLVLTNTGSGALLISGITVQSGYGDNFATSNNCPPSLSAGASCKIRVRFVPGGPGPKKSLLLITDNAGNSPQEITMTGVGVKTE